MPCVEHGFIIFTQSISWWTKSITTVTMKAAGRGTWEGSEVLLVVTAKTWNDLLVVISDVKLEQIDNDDYYYF